MRIGGHGHKGVAGHGGHAVAAGECREGTQLQTGHNQQQQEQYQQGIQPGQEAGHQPDRPAYKWQTQ